MIISDIAARFAEMERRFQQIEMKINVVERVLAKLDRVSPPQSQTSTSDDDVQPKSYGLNVK